MAKIFERDCFDFQTMCVSMQMYYTELDEEY